MVDGVESGVFLIDRKMFRPVPSSNVEAVLEGSQGLMEEDDDGEEALNEVHVGFSNSECHGRNPSPKRSALTVMDFDKALVSWESIDEDANVNLTVVGITEV